MNLVIFSSILFTLFGIHTCAVLPKSTLPSTLTSNETSQERGRSLPTAVEKKDDAKIDDHAGDHDQDDKTHSSGSSIKARKGVNYNDTSLEKVDDGHKRLSADVKTSGDISNDRASTTVTKTSESVPKATAEQSSAVKDKIREDLDRTASSGSSTYYTKSTQSKTDTSSSEISYTKGNASTTSNESKSKSATISGSTESISSAKSDDSLKKPKITFSVEDDVTLLNVLRTRDFISPLTPTDEKLEAENAAYLPPSSDFILDRMQSKREMYIFPLVVLIFLVPMVLGVGIIILRRVRDYWSTRHYRRMDFLVDGMYNT